MCRNFTSPVEPGFRLNLEMLKCKGKIFHSGQGFISHNSLIWTIIDAGTPPLLCNIRLHYFHYWSNHWNISQNDGLIYSLLCSLLSSCAMLNVISRPALHQIDPSIWQVDTLWLFLESFLSIWFFPSNGWILQCAHWYRYSKASAGAGLVLGKNSFWQQMYRLVGLSQFAYQLKPLHQHQLFCLLFWLERKRTIFSAKMMRDASRVVQHEIGSR